MDITNMVACNVKRLREEKKLTLSAAAEMTGVSRSMFAQIEKGDVNPTLSVLWKIANGLKVSFSSLIENKDDALSVVRNADVTPLIEGEGKYINYPVFSFDEKKLFENYRIVIKPGGGLQAEPHMKGVEEYITVFTGEVDITVDQTRYTLGQGDAIRFHADVAHSYHNSGRDEAQLSMLLYYNNQPV